MGRLRFFAVGLLAVRGADRRLYDRRWRRRGWRRTNTPPHAVATANPTSGAGAAHRGVQGRDSTDSNGTIATYSWNFGDGSATRAPTNPSHKYTAAGRLHRVAARDRQRGATDTAFVTISVGPPPNTPPVAVAHATPTSGKAPLAVAFSSAGSGDPDGSIRTYEWDFGDLTGTSNDPNPTHIYTTAGPKVATLTVTDNDGAVNTDSVTITANANQAPTAMASGLPDVGQGAPDGRVLVGRLGRHRRHHRRRTRGPSATGAPPPGCRPVAHVHDGGAQTATLTVTDDNGATDTKTVNISVVANHAADRRRERHAQRRPDAAHRALRLVAVGRLRRLDPDSQLGLRRRQHLAASRTRPTRTAWSGIHTATLTVTDDNGATDTDTVDVNVTPIPNVPPSAAASATPVLGQAGLHRGLLVGRLGRHRRHDRLVRLGLRRRRRRPTLANPTHTYTTPGDYLATLTVTDNAGGHGHRDGADPRRPERRADRGRVGHAAHRASEPAA